MNNKKLQNNKKMHLAILGVFLLSIGAILWDNAHTNSRRIPVTKSGQYQFIKNNQLVNITVEVQPILDKDK